MGKAKRSTTAEKDPGEEVVLKYMQTQNRPYSAVDVYNNLHGTVGKTAVIKILTALSEQGSLLAKTYGKQIVYVAKQDNLPTPSPEDLNKIDTELDALKAEVVAERERHRVLQTQLSSLQSSLTTEEMQERIGQLSIQNRACEAKLSGLRSGSRKVNPEEKRQVDSQWEKYQKMWKARKKMCMEVLNSIMENISTNPKDFYEEIGIELDPPAIPKK